MTQFEFGLHPAPIFSFCHFYYYYSIICNFMGFCSPQLRISRNSKFTALPTQLNTPLCGSLPHCQACELRLAGAGRGLRSGSGVASHAAASRPRNSLRFCALSRRQPSACSSRPPSRACEPGAGGGLCASRPRLRSRREEAGRRAEAGEEAGLRRAVAGAERGGRAAGTRLARLAASAHTPAPQPRASPALGSGVCGRRPERSRRNPGRPVRWTWSATPPATFCAAEVAAGMGGVRA